MASKDDFTLKFGSNAKTFASQLDAQLRPALNTISQLATALERFDKVGNNANTGKGALGGLLKSLETTQAAFARTAESFQSIGAEMGNALIESRQAVEALRTELAGLAESIGKTSGAATRARSHRIAKHAPSATQVGEELLGQPNASGTYTKNPFKGFAEGLGRLNRLIPTLTTNTTLAGDSIKLLSETLRGLKNVRVDNLVVAANAVAQASEAISPTTVAAAAASAKGAGAGKAPREYPVVTAQSLASEIFAEHQGKYGSAQVKLAGEDKVRTVARDFQPGETLEAYFKRAEQLRARLSDVQRQLSQTSLLSSRDESILEKFYKTGGIVQTPAERALHSAAGAVNLGSPGSVTGEAGAPAERATLSRTAEIALLRKQIAALETELRTAQPQGAHNADYRAARLAQAEKDRDDLKARLEELQSGRRPATDYDTAQRAGLSQRAKTLQTQIGSFQKIEELGSLEGASAKAQAQAKAAAETRKLLEQDLAQVRALQRDLARTESSAVQSSSGPGLARTSSRRQGTSGALTPGENKDLEGTLQRAEAQRIREEEALRKFVQQELAANPFTTFPRQNKRVNEIASQLDKETIAAGTTYGADPVRAQEAVEGARMREALREQIAEDKANLAASKGGNRDLYRRQSDATSLNVRGSQDLLGGNRLRKDADGNLVEVGPGRAGAAASAKQGERAVIEERTRSEKANVEADQRLLAAKEVELLSIQATIEKSRAALAGLANPSVDAVTAAREARGTRLSKGSAEKVPALKDDPEWKKAQAALSDAGTRLSEINQSISAYRKVAKTGLDASGKPAKDAQIANAQNEILGLTKQRAAQYRIVNKAAAKVAAIEEEVAAHRQDVSARRNIVNPDEVAKLTKGLQRQINGATKEFEELTAEVEALKETVAAQKRARSAAAKEERTAFTTQYAVTPEEKAGGKGGGGKALVSGNTAFNGDIVNVRVVEFGAAAAKQLGARVAPASKASQKAASTTVDEAAVAQKAAQKIKPDIPTTPLAKLKAGLIDVGQYADEIIAMAKKGKVSYKNVQSIVEPLQKGLITAGEARGALIHVGESKIPVESRLPGASTAAKATSAAKAEADSLAGFIDRRQPLVKLKAGLTTVGEYADEILKLAGAGKGVSKSVRHIIEAYNKGLIFPDEAKEQLERFAKQKLSTARSVSPDAPAAAGARLTARQVENVELIRRRSVEAAKALESGFSYALKSEERMIAGLEAVKKLMATGLNRATAQSQVSKALGFYGQQGLAPHFQDLVQDGLARVGSQGKKTAAKTGQEIGATLAEQTGRTFRQELTGLDPIGRAIKTAGVFAIRSAAASVTFGLQFVIAQAFRQAFAAQQQFVRISDSLRAQGVSDKGVQSGLQGIASQLGTPLDQVYHSAAQLSGVFGKFGSGAVLDATRTVQQLELISNGTLNATEGFRSLSSVAQAFSQNGVQGLQHVADVVTTIQNRLGVNVEDTLEGLGRISAEAKQFGLSVEQAGTLVGTVSKFTGQTGAASAEQLSRIFGSLNTPKAATALEKAGVVTPGEIGRTDAKGIQVGIRDAFIALINAYKPNADGSSKLSGPQKQNISASLGGPRQFAALSAILANATEVLNTFQAAENSTGAASRRVQAILNTFQGEVRRLKENFYLLAQTMVRSGLLDAFGLIVKLLNEMLTIINKLGGAFASLTDNGLGNKFRSIIGSIIGATLALKLFGAAIASFRGRQAAALVDKGLTNSSGGPLFGPTGTPAERTAAIQQAKAALAAERAASPQGPIRSAFSGGISPGVFTIAPLQATSGLVQSGLGKVQSGLNTFSNGITSVGTHLQSGGRAATFFGSAIKGVGTGVGAAGSAAGAASGQAGRLTSSLGNLRTSMASNVALAGVMEGAFLGLSIALGGYLQYLSDEKAAREAVNQAIGDRKPKPGSHTAQVQQDDASLAKRLADEESHPGFLHQIGAGVGEAANLIRGQGGVGFGTAADKTLGSAPKNVQNFNVGLTQLQAKVQQILTTGDGTIAGTAKAYQQAQATIDDQTKSLVNKLGKSGALKARGLVVVDELKKSITQQGQDALAGIQGLKGVVVLTQDQLADIETLVQSLGGLNNQSLTKYAEFIKQLVQTTPFGADKKLETLLAQLSTGGSTRRKQSILISIDNELLKQYTILANAASGDDLKNYRAKQEQIFADLQNLRQQRTQGTVDTLTAAGTTALNAGNGNRAVSLLTNAQIALRKSVQGLAHDDPAYIQAIQQDRDLRKQIAEAMYAGAKHTLEVALQNPNLGDKARQRIEGQLSKLQVAVDKAANDDGRLSATFVRLTVAKQRLAIRKAIGAQQIALQDARDNGDQEAVKRIEAAIAALNAELQKPRPNLAAAMHAAAVAAARLAFSRAQDFFNMITTITQDDALIVQAAKKLGAAQARLNELNGQKPTKSPYVPVPKLPGAGPAVPQSEIDQAAAGSAGSAANQADKIDWEAIRRAKAEYEISKIKDPIAKLRAQIAEAAREAAVAKAKGPKGLADYYAALTQEKDLENQLAQALQARAQAYTGLAIAIANAAGNTVRAAKLGVKLAQQKLREAITEFGRGSAEALQAQAELVSAQAAARDAYVQSRLDQIDFDYEINKITAAQAIRELQNLLKQKNLTLQEQRNIRLKIKQLQDEINGQGQFNIGDIKIPTIYEVRRFAKAQSAGVGYSGGTTNNTTNTITVNGADLVQVKKLLQAMLGANATSRLSTGTRKT